MILENSKSHAEDLSGCRPHGSCLHQLLAITPDIFSSFDCSPILETRGVFLDISKAFYRVWQDGLLFKFDKNGASAN